MLGWEEEGIEVSFFKFIWLTLSSKGSSCCSDWYDDLAAEIILNLEFPWYSIGSDERQQMMNILFKRGGIRLKDQKQKCFVLKQYQINCASRVILIQYPSNKFEILYVFQRRTTSGTTIPWPINFLAPVLLEILAFVSAASILLQHHQIGF